MLFTSERGHHLFSIQRTSEILPDTQTEIYKLFTISIILRQLMKSNKSAKLISLEHLQEEESGHFKEICRVAYKMTVDSRQVFNHGEFYADSQHSLGLVTTHRHAQWSGEYQKYSFLHLTLQEFLAAYHISKLSPEQQLDVIDQYSSSVHMRNWKFYFGLAKFSDEGIDRAKNIILNTSHDKLFPILCAYEAKQEAVVKLVSSKTFTLRLHQTYDMSALAYLMSAAACPDNEATPTTHMDVIDYTVNGGTCDLLLGQLSDRTINNLEEIKVHGNNSGLKVDTVANKYQRVERGSKLTSGVFKSLKVLYVDCSNIGDDGAKMIAEGIGVHSHIYVCTAVGLELVELML